MTAKNNQKNKNIWFPSIKWLLKTLIIIYTVIIVVFFGLNYFLKPYMRDIPKEVTPWLNK